jgi:hypothetical protein
MYFCVNIVRLYIKDLISILVHLFYQTHESSFLIFKSNFGPLLYISFNFGPTHIYSLNRVIFDILEDGLLSPILNL